MDSDGRRLARLPQTYRDYTVGLVRWQEIGQLARLEKVVFPEPMSIMEVSHKVLSARSVFIAVRDSSRVVAYCAFEVFGRYAHIVDNVTHPSYQGQGLGQFVVTAVEPLAQARGAVGFLGEVRRSNTVQLHVVEKIGWQRVTLMPHFFGNGEDAYLVWKSFPMPGPGDP